MSQQAVVDLRRLLRQRARWAQGNLQCVRYLWPLSKSRHIGSLGLLDFLFYLVSPWLSIPTTLLVLAAMTLAVVSLTTGNTFGGLMAGSTGIEEALALWLGALFIPGLGWGTLHWWRIADEPLRRCLLAGLCYPAYLVLGIVATWRGVARHALGRMSWIKTERHDEHPRRPAPALVDAVTTRMPGRGVGFQESATVVMGPPCRSVAGKQEQQRSHDLDRQSRETQPVRGRPAEGGGRGDRSGGDGSQRPSEERSCRTDGAA